MECGPSSTASPVSSVGNTSCSLSTVGARFGCLSCGSGALEAPPSSSHRAIAAAFNSALAPILVCFPALSGGLDIQSLFFEVSGFTPAKYYICGDGEGK